MSLSLQSGTRATTIKWLSGSSYIIASVLVFTSSCMGAQPTQQMRPSVATLIPVSKGATCEETQPSCESYDAIVFVHGIYGGADTFINSSNGFDWPRALQTDPALQGRHIDVFRLDYLTVMLSWAQSNNPKFEVVSQAIFDVMQPLRLKRYRSVGFIAHSLGGNLSGQYIVKDEDVNDHPGRAQNAFLITLATPSNGATIADVAGDLKTFLHIDDDLLASLQPDNLYLRVLNVTEDDQYGKATRHGCRAVHLFEAYETRSIDGIPIVPAGSGGHVAPDRLASPPKTFPVDHIQIAKPSGVGVEPYPWVRGIILEELARLDSWDSAHGNVQPPRSPLCEQDNVVPWQ